MFGPAGRARTIAVLLLSLPATAGAAPFDPAPLRLDAAVDGPVLALSALAWFAGFRMEGTLVRPGCDPCRPETVNPLDRSLAGRVDPVADKVSTALVGLTLLLPFVADGIDVGASHAGARTFGVDAGVLLEAIALDGALNEVVKLAVQRPRPLAYDPGLSPAERAAPDTWLSFYSEHSSLAFTAAAAYSTLFALRHRDRKGLSATVAVLGFLLASATSSLRAVSGKHFYTDVVVGSAVGSAVGFSVPMLHRRKTALRGLSLAPTSDGHGALLSIAFAN